MHWFLTEISEEPKRQKVEITIKETVDSKLRFAIFACLMVHYFLTDTSESSLFGKVRDCNGASLRTPQCSLQQSLR